MKLHKTRLRAGIAVLAGLVLAGLLLLVGLLLWRASQSAQAVREPALLTRTESYVVPHIDHSSDTALITRGAYLARAGDCIACHTASGGTPFAGGLRMHTPFGVIVSSNITPDKTYGIGAWSDAEFLRAVKHGVAPHGKWLYPAMPYNLYARVTDSDVLAIRAYLNTVPPVHAANASNQLTFPFNIRPLMLGWNLLFFNPAPFQPDPQHSVEWNRGAYLVDGLGHCSACHSGKNLLGGDTDYLQGYDLEGWHAPEITGNPYTGLGSWSTQDIVDYLQTGTNRYSGASGSMGEVVSDSTQYLDAADLKAIAVYLQSIPGSGKTAPAPIPAEDPELTLGHQIFLANCAACHQSDGTGVEHMIPAFAGNPGIRAEGANNVIRTILLGGRTAATQLNPTSAEMPAFDWKLSDAQVAAVSNVIRNSWGNAAQRVTAQQVATLRAELKAQPQISADR